MIHQQIFKAQYLNKTNNLFVYIHIHTRIQKHAHISYCIFISEVFYKGNIGNKVIERFKKFIF